MKVYFAWSILTAGLLAGCGRGPAPAPVEHVDVDLLLARMTQVATFAMRPLGDTFLESSSDPTGGNQDWAVWTQAEPSGRITLLAADGPGFVSRIWIASLDAQRWLFFFDGEEEPRIDVTQEELFGGTFPFLPPLAGESGGGRYSLMPIPFSRSLRVEIVPATLAATFRNYYQINYTRLALAPEAVQSYPRAWSSAQSNLVETVRTVHAGTRQTQSALIADCLNGQTSRELPAGESLVLWEDRGEGLLESFCLRIDEPAPAEQMQRELLRGLRLQMFWDGSREPSVDVPLGDFFCNPLYTRSFSSLPLGRVDDTYICRFPMPYERGARVLLTNYSSATVAVSAGAQGRRGDRGGLQRRFHAAWRATTRSGEPFRWLETSGSGHYVGCFLTAIGQDGSWNMLEGDEFLRPDPGEQPQQEGTGLEDYFSGAYYYTSLYDLPLHGLIEKGAMRTDQYRLHLLETVDFRKRFEAGIEFGHANKAQGYMSSVVYWYADRATPMPLPAAHEPLLARPADRFELHGLMAQFFLLERDGLHADAAARMEFFAHRFRREPWSDLLRVRALGYREQTVGFDALRPEYEAFTGSAFPPAAQAAQDRLWLAEGGDRALLGIHALGAYRLFLNDEEVAEGEGRGELRTLRIEAAPGAHRWRADLRPTRQGSFFSLCLRTAHGDFTSAGEWEALEIEPQPGEEPPETFVGGQVLPNMTVWAFEPNAWVGMQSPALGINTWAFWAAQPRVKRVVLAKDWILAAAKADAPSFLAPERSADELRAHAID